MVKGVNLGVAALASFFFCKDHKTQSDTSYKEAGIDDSYDKHQLHALAARAIHEARVELPQELTSWLHPSPPEWS